MVLYIDVPGSRVRVRVHPERERTLVFAIDDEMGSHLNTKVLQRLLSHILRFHRDSAINVCFLNFQETSPSPRRKIPASMSMSLWTLYFNTTVVIASPNRIRKASDVGDTSSKVGDYVFRPFEVA